MYNIVLMRRIVSRRNTPSCSDTNERIRFTTKRFVGKYLSNTIPRVGDIIRYINGVHYDVLSVVHDVKLDSNLSCTIEKEVVVEVKKHSNEHLYKAGSSSFIEEWLPITQIEEYGPSDFFDDDENNEV